MLRKGRRHIIHLVKNLLWPSGWPARRVSWFQPLTFHVSRWMTASPMWQQNNQLTSANQVIIFCKPVSFLLKTVIMPSYHNNYFFFLPSTRKFPIIVSGRTFLKFIFCIYLSLPLYNFYFFQIGFYFWIQNATCLNTIRDIEKLSTVLVSL